MNAHFQMISILFSVSSHEVSFGSVLHFFSNLKQVHSLKRVHSSHSVELYCKILSWDKIVDESIFFFYGKVWENWCVSNLAQLQLNVGLFILLPSLVTYLFQ